jgi:hypothetical protein
MKRSHEEIVHAIAHLVKDALQIRMTLVAEGSEGVEYEAVTVRERLQRDGTKADLSALRVGRYFSNFTEFNLLQWLDAAIDDLVEGREPRPYPSWSDD